MSLVKEPLFLTLAEVIEIHSDQIARYGGQDGIRDMGLLESAIAQPEASFGGEFLHKDLYAMAAAYTFHICCNHPFMDGNKRAALACALVFLAINGISLSDPKGSLYETMIEVASGKMEKDSLSNVFRHLPAA